MFGLLVSVAALAILIGRHSLFATGPVTISLQVLAALLMVWARITFGARSFHASADPTEGGLVTTGPYRFFRHPIYAAIIYFSLLGVVTHPSVLNGELWLVIVAGLGVRMFAEERLVIQRYPEYAEYAARTKRVIPFIW
jgi:protein-S-isoprenylcysteine O-methyltransferase Ste14